MMHINSKKHSAYINTGFSLIELMLSIAIGSFLILGAAFAFQEAQKTYSVNDNVARLQEQAQFVLDTLEEDIRMSNFWGLHNVTSAVQKHSTITDLESPDSIVLTGDCKGNWALDVDSGIYGTNNTNPAATSAWGETCIDSSDYQTGTDTLVVKHAGNNIVTNLLPGKVYVTSNETPQSILFARVTKPSASSSKDKIFELRSHGYYVRNYSFEDSSTPPLALDTIPMLRRKTLVDGGDSPEVQDHEISAGVQNFQVEFGIDTSALDSAERGSINRYVSPDSSLLDSVDTQILSVRVWVLMQALNEEQNFTNNATYSFAGINTSANGDSYRRLLVSRTFQIRNMVRTN